MEPTVIFLSETVRKRELKVISWNVNGVRTKLEKNVVVDMLKVYDVISLNEVKTQMPVLFPGYVSYKSDVRGSKERGGTVVLIKNYLFKDIASVDTSVKEQVWLKFRSMPKCLFGFVYIPPSDSEYYSHDSFASIQEKLRTSDSEEFCIIGDLNARFGTCIRDLPRDIGIQNHENYTYPVLPDDVRAPNENASILSSICEEPKMLVLNNLKTTVNHYMSKKTYKQGNEWVSELDVCLVSLPVVSRVAKFDVLRDCSVPSDHAPIAVTLSKPNCNVDELNVRAGYLGDHAVLHNNSANKLCKRPVMYGDVVQSRFEDVLRQCALPVNGDINVTAEGMTEMLYECIRKSENRTCDNYDGNNLSRWERMLQDRDDSRVWKAIDWRGNVTMMSTNAQSRPTDDDFKTHFETILNPIQAVIDIPVIDTDLTIPILDDPITVHEVEQQIQRMKRDKACGPDGLTPGVFSMLPPHWILSLVTLFNNVFFSGQYPISWTRAKMCTVFKKGDRLSPNNYRGISVTNSITKLYDMVMCERLYLWFTPFREQAGAQRNRGCLEHVVTLRLLTDTAKRKKIRLFVAFIDFSKAYDLVPRNKMFEVLREAGCGKVMLAALRAMYRVTECVMGSAVVGATQGVRQGLSTSCFLFVLYVNVLIKRLKNVCQPEPFLQWLHVLMLMDDTVLLSTTRSGIMVKLGVLHMFCQEYGMKVNVEKTKFFVINGEDGDREPLCVGNFIVEHCDSYMYLGSPFTCDGSISSSVKEHEKKKICQVLKFVSFVSKNNTVPFTVKRRVFEAALTSSLLFGCESWIGADTKPVIKLYHWAMKTLLGVRKNTSNLVCYAELGYPTLSDLLQHKQHKFLHKLWQERSGMADDPFCLVVSSVRTIRTQVAKIVNKYTRDNVSNLSVLVGNVHRAIMTSQTSRCIVYRGINPSMAVHEVYRTRHTINDLHRVSFTRFRVSGHSLAVETGRWNRRGRGRLPLEERLCSCGAIQTERHVVEICPVSQRIRNDFSVNSLEELFSGNVSSVEVCKFVYEMLRLY